MGWGAHPDTMSMAFAESAAMKEVGDDTSSLAFKKAYRNHYFLKNKSDSNSRSLQNYLDGLDKEIALLEKAMEDQ